MKLTKRKISILTLALVILFALTAFLGIKSFKTADAAGSVTVSGTYVFTATGNAKVAGKPVGTGDNSDYYSTFTFSDGGDAVSYRRNLAYSWFYDEVTKAEGEDDKHEVKPGWFSMTVGFKEVTFEKFVITFESQEYNKSKDGKAVNYLMLFPAATEGNVYALTTTDKDATVEDVENKTELNAGYIVIEFYGKLSDSYTGGYVLRVRNEATGSTPAPSVEGKLENVGGNYAKSSTSSTSPVYPLIFNAEFKENDENKKDVDMTLYELNGQSFKMTSSDSSQVTDDTAPVLCLESNLSYFKLNGDFDIDYVVIDVLRQSPPSPEVKYYLLTYKQYQDDTTDYNDDKLFKEAKDDVRLETDADKYLPGISDLNADNLKKLKAYDPANPDAKDPTRLNVDMLCKVYFTLSDTASGETAEVYLDWYLDDEYKITVNGSSFIAVAEDELGVTYNYGDGWEALKEDYQKKVDEAAKNLSAGSSNYIYLPSPESLFTDNATAYTDMKFSVYYYHDSKQNSSNLASTNLSITLSKPGKYTFTVYATDLAGNNMYYLEKVDGSDEDYDVEIEGVRYNVVEFAASEIWTMFDDQEEGGLNEKLPWFEFTTDYTGVEFEETPGMLATAYVGTAYTTASTAFKIKGVSGYSTEYRLFEFDRTAYSAAYGDITYSEFIEKMDELYSNPATRTYFTSIPEASALVEGTELYEKYYDYGWSNNSTSFTPQKSNTFYYIKAVVTDGTFTDYTVTGSLAIVSSDTSKALKGEDDWVENNVASIVLLSVAGAAAIGIILLLVIKPKNKGDIDEQFEEQKKKKDKAKNE